MRSLGKKFPPTLCGCVEEAEPLLLNKLFNCRPELFLLILLLSGIRYIYSDISRSGAVFRSKGSLLNAKDLCDFQLEVEDVCWKHRRSFGFKGKPHKSFRSTGLARVPSMKSIQQVLIGWPLIQSFIIIT